MESTSKFWLFKKHQKALQLTDYDYNSFRQIVTSKTNFNLATLDTVEDTIFDWNQITPHYSFRFDYIGCEEQISDWLKGSNLVAHNKVFIETLADEPIILVDTMYFIENWNDFINANNGMGSFIITEDMKLVMEFSDDANYLLYSNFKIKP